VREFDSIDVLTLRTPKRAATALARNPNVRYIEANGTMRAQALPWGYDRIDADVAHAGGVTGDGVDVAILDTGIDGDNACLPNVGSGEAFVSCSGSSCGEAWDDDNDHGTNVAGLVGAGDSCDCTTGSPPGRRSTP
ncbi:S8 family serine peptidase, partial [Halorussus sp. GCM10023401]